MNVLLIEDAPEVGRALSLLLQRAGLEVAWVMTGADAIKRAAAEPFDVIISDLWLSDTDGMSLMPKLQSRNRCPAIALSGDFLFGQLEDLRAAGFSSFARKPVDVDTLLLIIRRLVAAPSVRATTEPVSFVMPTVMV